jgi:hypothetical protein
MQGLTCSISSHLTTRTTPLANPPFFEIDMPRPLLHAAAALGVAFALGCGDQQSPTAPLGGTTPSPTVPSYARGDHGSGGAIVLRGTLLAGFWFSDPTRGLTTLIGVPAAGISDLSACGGTEEPEPHDLLGVIRPTGALKFLMKSQETSVAVWQLVVGGGLEDLCGPLAMTAPYAVGTARFRYVDNDLELPIEPGGNAVSLHANGTVTIVETGAQVRYLAVAHSVIPPGGTLADLRQLRADIKLR